MSLPASSSNYLKAYYLCRTFMVSSGKVEQVFQHLKGQTREEIANTLMGGEYKRLAHQFSNGIVDNFSQLHSVLKKNMTQSRDHELISPLRILCDILTGVQPSILEKEHHSSSEDEINHHLIFN